MKVLSIFLLCTLWQLQSIAVCSSKQTQQTDTYSLNLPLGKLQYTKDKLTISPDKTCSPSIEGNPVFWAIRIQDLKDYSNEIVFNSRGQQPSLEKTNSGFDLSYNKLVKDGKTWDISLTLHFTIFENAFQITGSIQNQVNGWVIIDFTGPVISGIQANLSSFPLLIPCGYGQKYIALPTEENPINKLSLKGAIPWKRHTTYYEISAAYPSRFATMQWCTLGGNTGGLYFGSHDKHFGAKRFSIRYYPENKTLGLSFVHQFVCHTGKTWNIPPLDIMPYAGTWHVAADHYRKWFDTAVKMPEIPHWAKNSGGWMLTIMKQQNEEIMWRYNELKEMCQLSEERGLDVLGLYGWAHGGHDRFYPDYHPDDAMGGRETLKEALKHINERGMRSIIYVNGQLIDQHGTDYWGETGQHITVRKQSGELDYQRWWKYKDAPARFHGMACLGCDDWYRRMLELAIQANELGADGIIYDQLAVTAPKYCYAPNHGHAVPAIVYEKDRYLLLDRIANYMKTINPDFIIMTEGLCDAVLSSISFFHGYENAVYVPLQAEWNARTDGSAPTFIYPEMFKYTFPEVLTTTRNPAPVNNRLILNYATVYGMRQELESRYAADVSYLKENRIPVPEDYDNVVSKPNIDLVTSEDPIASKIYTKQVIDFQRAHANILWHGQYLDEQGFSLEANSSVIAKSYKSGDQLGIVVWNSQEDKTETLTLNVPGYTLDYVCEPERLNVPPADALRAQCIRLYVWTKK